MATKQNRPIPMTGYQPTIPWGTPAGPARPEHREALEHAEEVFTVASKGVDRMAYDALSETMFVTWITGKTYAYEDVPFDKWESFKSAASKGKFANFAIKAHHPAFGPL